MGLLTLGYPEAEKSAAETPREAQGSRAEYRAANVRLGKQGAAGAGHGAGAARGGPLVAHPAAPGQHSRLRRHSLARTRVHILVGRIQFAPGFIVRSVLPWHVCGLYAGEGAVARRVGAADGGVPEASGESAAPGRARTEHDGGSPRDHWRGERSKWCENGGRRRGRGGGSERLAGGEEGGELRGVRAGGGDDCVYTRLLKQGESQPTLPPALPKKKFKC